MAGATGAIGRLLVAKLVAAGHDVTGTTRSEERAAGVRAAGAEAAVCDALDEQALRAAVGAARPEVVVHELTALPERIDYRDDEAFVPTNRLRTEGTRNLLAAAEAAGARRVVAQSVGFLYEATGGWVKSEEDGFVTDGPGPLGAVARAVAEHERAVTGSDAFDDGLVLRYGWVYGPGTYYAPGGAITAEVRRRRYPIVGRGQGVYSFVHVEDAADATVAAVEGGPPGVYNVVDDEPAAMREWLPALAEAAGAKRPLRVPVLIVRLAAGRAAAGSASEMRGATNAKAKRELGWTPRHPSWRDGFRESLA